MISQSNGTPRAMPCWKRMPRAPMIVSSTYRGMARKNQVYTQETASSTGLSDNRITARITPSSTPKTIDKTVTRIVPFRSPR